MNIDDYRAMVAEQEEEKNNPPVEPKEVVPEQVEQPAPEVVEPKVEDTAKPEETPPEQEPVSFDIDGQSLSFDEVRSGYMRQSDYTRKTQELKRKEEMAEEAVRFVEEIRKNPSALEALGGNQNVPDINREALRAQEMEQRYYDLLVEKEVSDLHAKYGEFDVEAVLTTASENNLRDLDTAYHIVQSRSGSAGGGGAVDADSIKEQIRQELMQEFQAKADTTTTISSGGGSAPIRSNAPSISAQEKKVAHAMGLSAKEYTQWRDGGK